MASKKQFDRFRRGERREGAARHGTYTKNVSRNAAQKGKAVLNRTITNLLFCVLLPPYGVYRVWTQRDNPPALKLAFTFLAALIMFLWFLLILPSAKPDTVSVPKIRSTAIGE